jgi:hypothetical protein
LLIRAIVYFHASSQKELHTLEEIDSSKKNSIRFSRKIL